MRRLNGLTAYGLVIVEIRQVGVASWVRIS
jgi:hypothetical protein